MEAVQRQSEANILVIGMGCLGVEVGKNMVLSGVRKVSIWDNEVVSEDDLCGQFYLWESDLGKNRGACTIQKLRHLNPYVLIEQLEGELVGALQECINELSVVVITVSTPVVWEIGKLCRRHNVKLILA